MSKLDSRYEVRTSTKFDRQLRKLVRQGKDLEKIIDVVEKLANGERLEKKYRDHALADSKWFYHFRECHIEPDWLLIYKYSNQELILFLIETGSHSDLFNK